MEKISTSSNNSDTSDFGGYKELSDTTESEKITKNPILTEQEVLAIYEENKKSYLNELNTPTKDIDYYLNNISYDYSNYVPSKFALEFMAFVGLVKGKNKQENTTPIFHYKILDSYGSGHKAVANLVFRGAAKTTLVSYLILYLAVYRKLPGYPRTINFIMYVSDTIENGVSIMRETLESTYEDSKFLKKVLPKAHFIEREWEFTNINNHKFTCKGFGIMTRFRGNLKYGTRPQMAILDDIISDENAYSETVMSKIIEIIYSALANALHPQNKKIFNGTPFNEGDALYRAIESGSWDVNIYPICEEFPVAEKHYKPAWGDRFPYEILMERYVESLKNGKASSFQQELMLRISSEKERLIKDSDIMWYHRSTAIANIHKYNVYITTDFATTDKDTSDMSVINVWLYSAEGDWLWVDGVCQQVLMGQTMKDLFRLCNQYKPMQVGLEISAQQKGFLSWIKQLQVDKSVYFNILPVSVNSNKVLRFFLSAVPLFSLKKIWFPEELRYSEELVEMLHELKHATKKGFGSRHDDQLDTISMLNLLEAYKPDSVGILGNEDNSLEKKDNPSNYPFHNGLGSPKSNFGEDTSAMSSYIVD